MGVPFAPTAGHLLLFPSWLEHRVERFAGAGDRISIAFNATNP
jgi:Putative 2OG-Fe(II) oxygenase